MITRIIVTSSLCALLIAACVTSQSSSFGDDVVTMSHGPILGRPAATSMTVWARTTRPSRFEVRFGTDPQKLDSSANAQTTELADDNTGYITLPDLKPATTYWYQVFIGNLPQGQAGSFRTWHTADQSWHPELNPKGLFNIRFQFGSCANQNPEHGIGHSLPLYQTMNRELVDNIDFAIMNGDWLYEELRATPPETWLAQNGVTLASAPKQVRDMPTIVGVWENYKLYLSREIPRCYPYYCVVQVNNAFNMPPKLGGTRLVAFPNPQVILQYFDGRNGKLAYSQTITGAR